MTYYELREEVWPFADIWGELDQKVAIKNYLRIVWEEHNDGEEVQNNLPDVKKEKDMILNWWWDRSPYYDPDGQRNIEDEAFGWWLLDKFNDNNKFDRPCNKKKGRNLSDFSKE